MTGTIGWFCLGGVEEDAQQHRRGGRGEGGWLAGHDHHLLGVVTLVLGAVHGWTVRRDPVIW